MRTLNFDDFYKMYKKGDERIYDFLNYDIIVGYLYPECNKDLSKYYNFRCWLESIEYCYRGVLK